MNKRFISVLLAAVMISTTVSGVAANPEDKKLNKEQLYETITSEYFGRYIVKYKHDETSLSDGQIDKAFTAAKADGSLDSNDYETTYALEEQKGYKPSDALTVYSLNEDNMADNYVDDKTEVIQLDEAVPADKFIEELSADASNIEYIQPDYPMSLAAVDSIEESQDISSIDGVSITQEGAETIETTVSQTNELVNNTALPESPASQENNIFTEEIELTPANYEPEEPLDEVIVALIDTAVDINHPELNGKLVQGYDFYNNTVEHKRRENCLEDVHGTHLAGVICEYGNNIKVMPLKTFENGKAYTSDIIRAIRYAEKNGAKIVNCSWISSEYNDALKQAMSESSLIFICAAGNNHMNIDENPIYPGNFNLDNIINVTAVNDDKSLCYFSNYGAGSVDIAAMGKDIEGLYLDGKRGLMSGTSVAAAKVSGAAAVLAGMHKQDIKSALMNHSDSISGLILKINNGKCLNSDNILNGISGQSYTVDFDDNSDGDVLIPQKEWDLAFFEDIINIAQGNQIIKRDGTVWRVTVDDGAYLEKDNFAPADTREVYDCGRIKLYIDGNGVLYEDGPCGFRELHQLGKIKQVSEGSSHMLVLNENGDVFGWGENKEGEVGGEAVFEDAGGYMTYRYHYEYEPIKILSGADKISTGYTISMALSGDSAYIWGQGVCDIYNHQHIPRIVDNVNVTDIKAIDNFGILLTNEKKLKFTNSYKSINIDGTNIEFIDENVGSLIKDTNNNLYELQYNRDGNTYNIVSLNAKFPEDTIKFTMSNYSTENGSGLVLTESGQLYEYIRIMNNISFILLNNGWYNDSGTIIADEQYNNPDNELYHADQTALENRGWKEGYYYGKGDFTAKSGQLIIRKTSPQIDDDYELIYDVTKTFTERIDNWNNDTRLSVWTNNFKGVYEIDIKGSFNQTIGQVYYDVLGATNTGQKAIVARYKIDPASGGFHVNNCFLNEGDTRNYTLWSNPSINRGIRTVLDCGKAEFQTFENDSILASKTTVEGATPNDTFNMTDWTKREPTEYITGIRFSAQSREAARAEIAKLDHVKLIEHSKIEDCVDIAIANMSMDDLTDTPEAVVSDLKALPSSLNGANITWTSSRKDIITDSGDLIWRPSETTDVIMTAKVTNPQDNFTKYMEFKLTVPAQKSFTETYSYTLEGTPSGYNGEGTTKFEQLPMWTFSYPGINTGTNGQMHAAQVLVKDNYLTFKKLSDRQTDNYKECLVGVRDLSNDEHDPLLSSVDITVDAKVYDTGTMRLEPLTIYGDSVCTLILDASLKQIRIVSADSDGKQITQTIQKDPTVDRKYTISLKHDGTFSFLIDNTPVGDVYNIFSDAKEMPIFSKLKVWITNITYGDKEVGKIKSITINNDVAVTNENIISVWKDMINVKNNIPSVLEDNLEIPAIGVNGSNITWSSSSNLISGDGTVSRPDYQSGAKKVTVTINAEKNGYMLSDNIILTVPTEENSHITNIYPDADGMVKGGLSGMTGTERYGFDSAASIATKMSGGTFTGSCMLLRFDLSDTPMENILSGGLNLYITNCKMGEQYSIAVLENSEFNNTWSENTLMYPAVKDMTFEKYVGFSTNITASSAIMPLNIDLTSKIKEIKALPEQDQILNLCIYSADSQSDSLTLTTKEYSVGAYRPHLYIVNDSVIESMAQTQSAVPSRSIGYEYEYTDVKYTDSTVRPEIQKVKAYMMDPQQRIYKLVLSEDNIVYDKENPDCRPFYFWTSNDGGFVECSSDYSSVYFYADDDISSAEIVTGFGDGLGLIDRRKFILELN